MTKRQAFATSMAVLFAAFDKPLSDLAVEAYWLVLSDFSEEQLRYALKRSLETAAFMPPPAVVRQHAIQWRDPRALLAPEQPKVDTFNYPTNDQQREIRALLRNLAYAKSVEPS